MILGFAVFFGSRFVEKKNLYEAVNGGSFLRVSKTSNK